MATKGLPVLTGVFLQFVVSLTSYPFEISLPISSSVIAVPLKF